MKGTALAERNKDMIHESFFTREQLATYGGAVTHTVEKDENGNIILVPTEQDND